MPCSITFWHATGLADGYAGRYQPPIGKVNHPLDLGSWQTGYEDGRKAREKDGVTATWASELTALRQRVAALEARG